MGPRTSYRVDWVPWWWSWWLGARWSGSGLHFQKPHLAVPVLKSSPVQWCGLCCARTLEQSSPWLGHGSPEQAHAEGGEGGAWFHAVGAGREAGATPLCSRGHELPALQTGDQGHLTELLPNW